MRLHTGDIIYEDDGSIFKVLPSTFTCSTWEARVTKVGSRERKYHKVGDIVTFDENGVWEPVYTVCDPFEAWVKEVRDESRGKMNLMMREEG